MQKVKSPTSQLPLGGEGCYKGPAGSREMDSSLFNLILALTIFFSLSLSSIQAQFNKNEYVEIISANSLESNTPGIQELIGDVKLRQGSMYLSCDKAVINEKTNDFTATGHVYMNKKDSVRTYSDMMEYLGITKQTIFSGNVRLVSDKTTLETSKLTYENNGDAHYENGATITQESTKIFSKRGTYFTSKHLIAFRENVVVKAEEFYITSNALDYDTKTKITYFIGPTNIVSKNGKIYCEAGYFDNNKGEAVFRKNAVVKDKAMVLRADSIYRNTKKAVSHAYGHVNAKDTVDNVTITGGHGIFYEKAGKTVMTEAALLEQLIDNDTLFLHADTLRALNDTAKKEKKIYAYHGVRFLKNDLSGICDSLTYFPSDSLIKLFRNPVLWMDKSQISGQYIEILIYENKIHELRVKKNGFIISQNGKNAFDQIKGREMTGYFSDGKMKKMKVMGNGETVYFAKEKDSSYTGVNKAECSNLLIHFKDNKVSKIKFYQKPDAIFIPIAQIDLEKLKLKDFMWRIEDKPKDVADLLRNKKK